MVRLAEKRLRTHELSSQVHARADSAAQPAIQPFVCISRMVGSGGTELANVLARRLGWPVYDREILHAMAGDDDTRARVYASLDEREPGWTEDTLRALMDPGFSRNDYFHRLQTTVWTAVKGRPGIFVGRGVDLILPRQQGLRLRVVAPREQCLQNFADRYRLPSQQARLEVERVEGERAAFVRSHFHREPGDSTRYDLIVNLGCFSVEEAAEVVLTAMRARRLIS